MEKYSGSSGFSNLGYGRKGDDFWTTPNNSSSLSHFSSLVKPREIYSKESSLWK